MKRAATTMGVAGFSLLVIACDPPVREQAEAKAVFNPVLSSHADQFKAFLAKAEGGPKAKLVFVDKTGPEERLRYIDYSEPGPDPIIRTITQAKRPALPVISPDGNWVVYASGSGAEAGSPSGARSSVFFTALSEASLPILVAADSACEPRFVQDNPGRVTILYTTLAPDFAWEGYGRTMKVDIDVSGPTPVAGTPQPLFAHGSYTGGLSWDGRYLCGGGGHVAMIDLQSGKTRPDTLSYQGVQACNASISSSRIYTSTMMYLNLETSHPVINAGKPWSRWQAILISAPAAGLRKGYMVPTVFDVPLETDPKSFTSVKWHHNEWSNHPYFATATLNVDRYFKTGSEYSNTGYQERVYALNLKDSTYLELLRPDAVSYRSGDFTAGFHWPWLWVEIPADFQESPAWLD